MSNAHPSVHTTLRIPGAWSHPEELVDAMPDGFRITPQALRLPDGTEIECYPMPADEQFAQIFQASCRRPAAADELATVARYTVNVVLSGPGGSLDAALQMMQAGAAIVRAGGAGVFIDNSALAHGGGHWVEMADDGGPDALSFGFVSIIAGEHNLRTMGMHVLGFPEVVMRRSDVDADGETIIEVIRYICTSEKPICDGHLLCDLQGVRFQATATATANDERAGSPMDNPFGCLRMTSIKEIAEGN